jgi:hypothetical protein
VTAGLGFLSGILWIDLMFDLQMLRSSRSDERAAERSLSAVAAYYRHATSGARPLDLMIAVVMIATVLALVAQLLAAASPRWLSWTSLITAGGPIALALAHTVPSAIKLGALADASGAPERSGLARRILRDHLIALTGIVGTLLLQLLFGS